MENIQTLNTVIKFVSGGGGSDPVTGVTNAVADASSAATGSTGDFAFLLLALVVVICGICAMGAIILHYKKINACMQPVQVNPEKSNHHSINKFLLLVVATITCILSASLFTIGIGSNKALADTDNILTGAEQVIGTVDSQTGATTFSEVTITNTTESTADIQEFSLQAVKDVDVSDITWKITIGDTVVYNNQIGEIGVFTPFVLAPYSTSVMKIEATNLTAEKAKSLINKEVATCTNNYLEVSSYYNGVVVHPNEDGSSDVGLEGATAKFIVNDKEIDSTVTNAGGKYSFTKAGVGMDGKIVVTKNASPANTNDYNYSTDTIIVDKTMQTQAQAHLGQIQSLAVKVFWFNSACTSKDLQSTYWCPAFADFELRLSDIKFYEGNYEESLITPDYPEKGYRMAELVNDRGTTADEKMKAKYFAICTSGTTLNCYQTTDATYDEAFGDSSVVPGGRIATSFISSFSKAINSSGKVVDRLQDANGKPITPHGVYWDTKDKANWIPTGVAATDPFPTVNGVNYSKKNGEDGWCEIYGGYSSGLIGYYCEEAWSAVAASADAAYRWLGGFGNWYYSGGRTYGDGVVLSYAFKS